MNIGIGSALASDKRAVLRAERNIGGSLAQHAIAYDEQGATLNQNSNFYCPSSSKTLLGVFQAKPNLSQIKNDGIIAESIQRDMEKLHVPVGSKNSHELRLYAGEARIDLKSKNAKHVSKFLDLGCKPELWSPTEAVSVELVRMNKELFLKTIVLGAKQNPPLLKSVASGACKKNDGLWHCLIPSWGLALLKEPL